MAYREFYPKKHPYEIVLADLAQAPRPEWWTYHTTAALMILLTLATGFFTVYWLGGRWTRQGSIRQVFTASAAVAVIPILFMAFQGIDRLAHYLDIPVSPPLLIGVVLLGMLCGLMATAVTSALALRKQS